MQHLDSIGLPLLSMPKLGHFFTWQGSAVWRGPEQAQAGATPVLIFDFSILLRGSKAEALLEEHVAQQARGETELKADSGSSCIRSSFSSFRRGATTRFRGRVVVAFERCQGGWDPELPGIWRHAKGRCSGDFCSGSFQPALLVL